MVAYVQPGTSVCWAQQETAVRQTCLSWGLWKRPSVNVNKKLK